MNMKGTPLRGAVTERFGSCAEFAKALKWSGRKTRDIVSGRRRPNANEIIRMAKALNVMNSPETFMHLFFTSDVHNVDEE